MPFLCGERRTNSSLITDISKEQYYITLENIQVLLKEGLKRGNDQEGLRGWGELARRARRPGETHRTHAGRARRRPPRGVCAAGNRLGSAGFSEPSRAGWSSCLAKLASDLEFASLAGDVAGLCPGHIPEMQSH